MQLWTDLIKPAEITAFSREIVANNDAAGNPATLANVFPSLPPILGSTFSFDLNARVEDVAEYRAFDAEAKIGAHGGRERRTVELPPVSLKKRLTEHDQVQRGAADSYETVQAAAERLGAETAAGIVNRLVLARSEALVTGQLIIEDAERGFRQTVDFERRPDFTTAAAAKWDATSSPGDPVTDLVGWRNAMAADEYAGGAPDVMYMSSTVMAVLMRSAAIRGYYGTAASGLVGIDQIRALFQNYGLPAPIVEDRTVAGKRIIPEKTIILARSGAGATVWGTTVEATDPRYGLAYPLQPGLVTGAYRTDDPAAMWIRSNAIAMPVLGQANATLAAVVLK